MCGQVAVHGHEEVHVHTVGEVAQLVQLVHGDVLQVRHLQHVGRQERAFQRVDVARVHPASVDVVEYDGEDLAGDAVDGDGLVPGLGHAAGEHGEEVLAVGREDDAVGHERLPFNNQNNIREMFILNKMKLIIIKRTKIIPLPVVINQSLCVCFVPKIRNPS